MNTPTWPLLVLALLAPPAAEAEPATLDSPDGRLRLTFRLDDKGRPGFDAAFKGKAIASGTLGLEFAGSGPLAEGLSLGEVIPSRGDATYPVAVGKTSSARSRYNTLTVWLREPGPAGRHLNVEFRAFDDGLAFRYNLPARDGFAEYTLLDERTRLSFPADTSARALPLKDYTTSYENYYVTKKITEMTPGPLFALPMLMEQGAGADKTWLALTEANLTDYAGMYVTGGEGMPGTLAAKLSPLPGRSDGAKVVGKAPFKSPWRVLMVADDPGRLIESNIVFNLSEPSKIADTSWIKPGKTTFPWWNGYVLEGVDFKPGVNTATMKHYIDFCAGNGIPYHSLDGLDIAWYGGPIQPNGKTDITKGAPSIDMPELLRYSREKGVRLRLWMHWKALKPQIDEAFAVYEKWGIEGVMVDFMDRDDQEMVAFYHEMASKAAQHHLTLTLHGAYKPTGLERTWPNVLSYEAALNQEYDKWEKSGEPGTPPSHNLDIAFVRMLAGPLDYHQGGMRSVLPENYKPRDKAPMVQGTRGHQLAMYVVYQNHLPMMADYPAAYKGQAGLEFIAQTPCTWDETRVLVAEPGRCLVVARRRGDDWWIGGMTAPEKVELSLALKFLGDRKYEAELHLDDPAGGPNALKRETRPVSSAAPLTLEIPRAGGFAARLSPLKH